MANDAKCTPITWGGVGFSMNGAAVLINGRTCPTLRWKTGSNCSTPLSAGFNDVCCDRMNRIAYDNLSASAIPMRAYSR